MGQDHSAAEDASYNVLVIGLDNSGKSALIDYLKPSVTVSKPMIGGTIITEECLPTYP